MVRKGVRIFPSGKIRALLRTTSDPGTNFHVNFRAQTRYNLLVKICTVLSFTFRPIDEKKGILILQYYSTSQMYRKCVRYMWHKRYLRMLCVMCIADLRRNVNNGMESNPSTLNLANRSYLVGFVN